MFINHFIGFKRFVESEGKQPQMFTTTVTRDYLGQNFYWDGSMFPVTQMGKDGKPIMISNARGEKFPLMPGTNIGIEKQFASQLKKEPDANQKVRVVIGNKADPKIPTQSDTAHGKPTPHGDETITIPWSTFTWLIQQPGGGGGGAGGMPGMPGMAGGAPPGAPPGGPPGGAAPGGAPPGAPPM